MISTRFAPSPTGYLHLGHIYAASKARSLADFHQGVMRLRIEDIDHTRCHNKYHHAILEDLAFMEIPYDGEIIIQSERFSLYQKALNELKQRELVYPCYLTRREINALLSAPHGTPYAVNTDELLSEREISDRIGQDQDVAWRLRMEAIRPLIKNLSYQEGDDKLTINLDEIDDAVIARKDIGTSYHLSVVVDDHENGITHITRGDDLKASTPLHRLLQHLLGFQETIWNHHPLLLGNDGKRLAKRNPDESINDFRLRGFTPDDIHQIIVEREKLASLL